MRSWTTTWSRLASFLRSQDSSPSSSVDDVDNSSNLDDDSSSSSPSHPQEHYHHHHHRPKSLSSASHRRGHSTSSISSTSTSLLPRSPPRRQQQHPLPFSSSSSSSSSPCPLSLSHLPPVVHGVPKSSTPPSPSPPSKSLLRPSSSFRTSKLRPLLPFSFSSSSSAAALPPLPPGHHLHHSHSHSPLTRRPSIHSRTPRAIGDNTPSTATAPLNSSSVSLIPSSSPQGSFGNASFKSTRSGIFRFKKKTKQRPPLPFVNNTNNSTHTSIASTYSNDSVNSSATAPPRSTILSAFSSSSSLRRQPLPSAPPASPKAPLFLLPPLPFEEERTLHAFSKQTTTTESPSTELFTAETATPMPHRPNPVESSLYDHPSSLVSPSDDDPLLRWSLVQKPRAYPTLTEMLAQDVLELSETEGNRGAATPPNTAAEERFTLRSGGSLQHHPSLASFSSPGQHHHHPFLSSPEMSTLPEGSKMMMSDAQPVSSPTAPSEISSECSGSNSILADQKHRQQKWHGSHRGQLSRDAKALRTRIRRLWQDPRQPEHVQRKQNPKSPYVLLEDSLTGILQIVPLIIQSTSSAPGSVVGTTYAASTTTISTSRSQDMLDCAQTASVTSTLARPATVTTRSSAGTASCIVLPPATSPPASPLRTRARTTSSGANSIASVTRYQIATSMLQPPEYPLSDVTQPSVAIDNATAALANNMVSLGGPSLSSLSVSMAVANRDDPSSEGDPASRMAQSNRVLVDKLVSLSSTFTKAVKSLCDQQHERVLRFDDDVILELLLKWEQEAAVANNHEGQEGYGAAPAANNDSSTSLVTLDATNALERYQITVGRIWEETDIIRSCIRDIREIVQFGRVQSGANDFDDADSEDDVLERDEHVRKTIYSTLLLHTNALITVLGEFLECISSIQRLFGSMRGAGGSDSKCADTDVATSYNTNQKLNQALQSDGNTSANAISEFMLVEEPRPIRHLDPALTRRLKRRNPPKGFRALTDKMRHQFTQFTKRSTDTLLAIFPPLGDGMNEGALWDSDYEYGNWESDDPGSTTGGMIDRFEPSLFSDDDYSQTSSSAAIAVGGGGGGPSSPDYSTVSYVTAPATIVPKRRHRRLSSKGSEGMPEQYWPGSQPLHHSNSSDHGGNLSDTHSRLASPDITYSAHSSGDGSAPLSSTPKARMYTRRGSSGGESSATIHNEGGGSSLFSSSSSSTTTQPPQLHPLCTGPEDRARQSLLFRRRGSWQPKHTSISAAFISAPLPFNATNRYSTSSSAGSEPLTPTKNNYKVAPPPLPNNESGGKSADSGTESRSEQQSSSNTSGRSKAFSYLAARTGSPQLQGPLTLDSPFHRQTSIRMSRDRNRYSIRMPTDITTEDLTSSPMNGHTRSSSSSSASSSFWRRRSFNDALERTWNALMNDAAAAGNSDSSSTQNSTEATPTTATFGRRFRSNSNTTTPSGSVHMSLLDCELPAMRVGVADVTSANVARINSNTSRINNTSSHSTSSSDSSESATVSPSENSSKRRYSSPLMVSVGTLGRRMSNTSQQSSASTTSSSNSTTKTVCAVFPNSNRTSLYATMPTVTEDKASISYNEDWLEGDGEQAEKRVLPTQAEVILDQEDRQPQMMMMTAPNEDATVIETQPRLVPGKPKSGGEESASTSRMSRPAPRPISVGRFQDMRRAWELLNQDVKKQPLYSPARISARNVVKANRSNAIQPHANRVLHICENGVDVMVLETMEGRLQVVAGRLEKLIERLADESTQDIEYMSYFILSHSFFIESEDFLDALIARFHIQPRQGELLYFQKWQAIIQVKTLCVIEKWIQLQYEDFELNPNLLKTLKRFLEYDVRMAGYIIEAECIEKSISIKSLSSLKNCSVIMEQGRFCLQRSRTRKLSLSRSQNCALNDSMLPSTPETSTAPQSPLVPKNLAKYIQDIEFGPTPELAVESPILDLDTRDLARYLTLADMSAFRSITVFELMSGWWKRRQESEALGASSEEMSEDFKMLKLNFNVDSIGDGAIEAFTRRANMLSYWVAHEIVSVAGTKTRKQLIKKFIEVAKICRSLNNMHTCMFIVSALMSTPVRRLTSTWKLMSARHMETLKTLELLLDPTGNMKNYRQTLDAAEPPTIPFLPILLKDITFILDGNPSKIMSRGNLHNNNDSHRHGQASELINFDKFRRLAQYVEQAVDMARMGSYSFEHQLLRQARVFRPSPSPSTAEDPSKPETVMNHYPSSPPSPPQQQQSSHPSFPSLSSSSAKQFFKSAFHKDSLGGGPSMGRTKSTGAAAVVADGSHSPVFSSSLGDNIKGVLDPISEIVENRLVKASGLYGVHQRVIQVEFVTRAKGSSGIWKPLNGGGGVSLGGASQSSGTGGATNTGTSGTISGPGNTVGSAGGGSAGYRVIRTVQGEEDYLMGLSLMCEPGR